MEAVKNRISLNENLVGYEVDMAEAYMLRSTTHDNYDGTRHRRAMDLDSALKLLI